MKKIFTLIASLMMVLSMNAATKTIYCKMAQSWWKADGAAVGAYAWNGSNDSQKNADWPGVRMTPVTGETDLWSVDIDTDKYTKIIFTRVNGGSGTVENWGAQTGDLTIPTDAKNLFTITTSNATWGGNPGCVGEWSTYTPAATPEPEPEPEPVADVTVHFINTPNWAEVACHHWIPNGAGTSWPGDVLSKTDEIAGYDVYTATFTGAHTSCIFNNNNKGSQTGDLTVVDGNYYALSTDTWYADKAAAEAALATPLPDETIYFVNNKKWTTINVYAWGGSKSDLNASWPGKPVMTKTAEKIGEYEVYSLTATQGSYKNLIFNDGSAQTADYVWSNGKYYWVGKDKDFDGDTKENAEAALATPTEDVYTVVGSAALCGSDWNASDATNDMTLVDGLYVWTKENVTLTGNASFKIVKNHDYGQGEWPSGFGQNATIDISTSECTEGGTYSIKITFNPATGDITPTIEECEGAAEPIVHTYTVVGQAVLCGSDWNTTDATNDMALTDGVYVWTKANVELNANAEFRIVKDHAYDEAYPDGNYVIDLTQYEGAAIYDVTITFNAETKEITVAMEKKGDVTPVVYTYYLMGVDGDWETGIEMELNPNDANEYMLLCQSITADEPIKIKAVDTQSNETWCAKLADTSLGTVVNDAEGNENIVLDEGKYDFYYKVAENEVWIGTCTETPEVGGEMDLLVTDLVIMENSDAQMALLMGTDSEVGIEFALMLTGYTGEYNKEYQLSADESVLSLSGEESLVSGSLTKISDPDLGDVYQGVVYATLMGMYWQFNLTMYYVEVPAIEINVNNATVVEELYDNYVGGTGSEWSLSGNWTYEGEPATVKVTIYDEVDKSVSQKEMQVDVETDYGFVQGNAMVIIDATTMTVQGELSNQMSGAKYKFNISGALPTCPTIRLNIADNKNVLAATNNKEVNVIVNRSFEANDGYYTLCLPFDMQASVVGKAYQISTITEHAAQGINVEFTEVTTMLAGQPYLIKPNNLDNFTVEAVTIKNTTTPVTVTGEGISITMQGMFNRDGKTNGLYWVGNGGYLYNDDVYTNGLCAYFNISTPSGVAPRMRVVTKEDAETGVEDIFSTDAPVKAIVNGQLIIIRDGVKYNVQGQKL